MFVYHASYVIKLCFLRSTVQNFSFVMNDEHAVRSFGFCRTAPNADTALVSYQELNQFANRASRFCPSGHDVESSVARSVLQVAQPRGGAHSVFRRRRTRTLPRRLLQCTGENANYVSMREPTADNYQSISGSPGRCALPRVVELPTVAGGRPNVSEEEGLFLSDSDIARASVDT